MSFVGFVLCPMSIAGAQSGVFVAGAYFFIILQRTNKIISSIFL